MRKKAVASESRIDLGLGSLDEFTPMEREPPRAEDAAAIDRTAHSQGFGKVAMPVERPRRRARRAAREQLHQINVRGPVSVIQRFVDYCDEQRLAYWEAIERLLKHHVK